METICPPADYTRTVDGHEIALQRRGYNWRIELVNGEYLGQITATPEGQFHPVSCGRHGAFYSTFTAALRTLLP